MLGRAQVQPFPLILLLTHPDMCGLRTTYHLLNLPGKATPSCRELRAQEYLQYRYLRRVCPKSWLPSKQREGLLQNLEKSGLGRLEFPPLRDWHWPTLSP